MAPPHRGLNEEERRIHELLKQMTDATDDAISNAVNCFQKYDTALAQQVTAGDAKINALQHQVEEECMISIARHQPVARDLRELIAGAFIASDLERIADYASNIAATVMQLSEAPEGRCVELMTEQGARCRSMLQSVMKSYHEHNEALARQVADEDDALDATEEKIIQRILELMNTASDHVRHTHMLWISHSLERIGDHITNIAERVVFMETGVNVDLNHP
jgi:phosphate transport system protein